MAVFLEVFTWLALKTSLPLTLLTLLTSARISSFKRKPLFPNKIHFFVDFHPLELDRFLYQLLPLLLLWLSAWTCSHHCGLACSYCLLVAVASYKTSSTRSNSSANFVISKSRCFVSLLIFVLIDCVLIIIAFSYASIAAKNASCSIWRSVFLAAALSAAHKSGYAFLVNFSMCQANWAGVSSLCRFKPCSSSTAFSWSVALSLSLLYLYLSGRLDLCRLVEQYTKTLLLRVCLRWRELPACLQIFSLNNKISFSSTTNPRHRYHYNNLTFCPSFLSPLESLLPPL